MSLSKAIKNLVVKHIEEYLTFVSENGQDKAVLEELYKKFSESLPKKSLKKQPKTSSKDGNLCQVLLKSGARKNEPCGKDCPYGKETCSKHKSSAKKKPSREQEEFDDDELTEGFFKSEEAEEAEKAEVEAKKQAQFQKNKFQEKILKEDEELSESDSE